MLVCLLPRSVKKIAGHVSPAVRNCILAPENARHLRMYASQFFSATEIFPVALGCGLLEENGPNSRKQQINKAKNYKNTNHDPEDPTGGIEKARQPSQQTPKKQD
jgi:hypothetical protein